MTAPLSPLVPVVAGGRCLGHLLARGRAGIEVFDANDGSVGVFPTQREAVNALLDERGRQP